MKSEQVLVIRGERLIGTWGKNFLNAGTISEPVGITTTSHTL